MRQLLLQSTQTSLFCIPLCLYSVTFMLIQNRTYSVTYKLQDIWDLSAFYNALILLQIMKFILYYYVNLCYNELYL